MQPSVQHEIIIRSRGIIGSATDADSYKYEAQAQLLAAERGLLAMRFHG